MDSVSSLIEYESSYYNNNILYDLTEDDINQLINQGNKCNNWKNIKFSNSNKSISSIRNCNFDIKNEDCICIGNFDIKIKIYDDIEVLCGLNNCTFSGSCVICNNCYIIDTIHIRNTFICENSIIIGCGIINCIGTTSFSNNTQISIGPENGGRDVYVYTGLKYSSICKSIINRNLDNTITSISFQSNKNIIGFNSIIMKCDMIRNSLIGSFSSILSSSIDNCTLNSNKDRPIRIYDKATLKSCILNHDCSASGSCHAENVYMFESSSLGEYARVVQSILGPDSSIAGGECHHSLLGPFVGFHHHSLLIASTWAMGRGNIGYGAKIGANHTGRINDQECFLGEGCFLGLDSTVKFPFNIIGSPYSIIAANTKCQSQKLTFPFSLIYSGEDNEIVNGLTFIKPGWILSANPYLIERSDIKYGKRSKSKYHNTKFPILRPSIIEMVIRSLNFLKRIIDDDKIKNKPFITSNDVEGCECILGKCCLSLKDIEIGIKSYSDLLYRYAQEGLFNILQLDDRLTYFEDDQSLLSLSNMTIEELIQSELNIYDNLDNNDILNYTRKCTKHRILLLKRLYPLTDFCQLRQKEMPLNLKQELRALLQHLIALENDYINSIKKAKNRDTIRGSTIIPDYILVNKSANDSDDVIKYVEQKNGDYVNRIQSYINDFINN